MNIKDPRVHELARELARLTGESLTETVEVSVEEGLERLRTSDDTMRARADALLAIGRDSASRLQEPGRSADHGALLYDELGLPR